MTSQRAYYFAKLLEQSPSIYATPPDLYKASGAIETATPGSTHYVSFGGFYPNYGCPNSKHGRYMTLSDLRMFYYLGTEVAKYKLYGWQSTQSYNSNYNNNISEIFNGEGLPICRHRSGYKMVRTSAYGNTGSYPTLPYSYKADRGWKPLLPSPKWKVYKKSDYLTDENSLNQHYEIDTIDIPLSFSETWYEKEYLTTDLTQTSWTYKYILPFETTTDCLVSWPIEIIQLIAYYPHLINSPLTRKNCLDKILSGRYGEFVKDGEAANEATPQISSITVKISPYPDVYENPEHFQNVIQVGFYGEKLTSPKWWQDYSGTKQAWSNNLIPLTKGTW